MSDKYIVAVDLGGTNLKIGLLNSRLAIVRKTVLSTVHFPSKEALVSIIVHSVNSLLKEHGIAKSRVAGVGIGVPGPVEYDRGLVYFFPNIPGWKNVGLRQLLQRKLGLPVFLDNDANVMGLAECTRGAAKDAKCAVCLTLGTGVGGSIVVNKHLFRGVHNATGEIGHLPINERGPRCNCGGIACLEKYIGNRTILARARQLLGTGITLEEASARARKGNPAAVRLWREVGGHLGVALASVVNLLNPDYIVIGGGVANAGKVLFDEVKRTVRTRAMRVQGEDARIVAAALGPEAGMIGAAVLVQQGVN